jgi:peptide/nickel transport system substrate-binding protein
VVVLSIWLASATVAAPSTNPVLSVALASAGTNLNPAVISEGSAQLMSTAYASITHMKPDGTIVPGLATSWKYVGSGNRTFRFTLRPNAKFSDGTPVTASAVKTWLDYYTSAKGPFATSLSIKSVQAIGTSTVVLHLSTAVPELPEKLSEPGTNVGFVVSPKGVAKPSSLSSGTDGAGPYMAVPSQTVIGNHYTFVPNPYYYDPSAVHYSKIVYRIVSQPSTRLAAILSGQVDVAFGDFTTVDSATKAGLNVVSAPSGWAGFLIIDRSPTFKDGTTPNPLSKLQVRQALNYALDRKAIVKGLLGTNGTPSDEIPTVDGWDPKFANYYSYDPAKAKSLLAAAGYPNGFTLTSLDQTFAGGTLGDPLLQAMAKYFQAVGVKLDIKDPGGLPQWVQAYVSGAYPASGQYQTPVDLMSNDYIYFFGPKSFGNHAGVSDPALDQLDAQAAAAANPTKYWKALSDRTVTQALAAPVFLYNSFWYAKKNVGGVAFSAKSGYVLPFEFFPK